MKLRQMPFYETDAQGQKVKRMSSRWYAVFVDYADILRRLPLLTDRKASGELARKIERLNSIRAGGDVMSPELARYIETMPPGIRAKLAEWGILSAARVAAGKPLADHLADWKQSLLAKGNTGRHAELVTSRARNAFRACGFKVWTDISSSKLQAHLAQLRADKRTTDGTVDRGISIQTSNFYLQAAKQFCRWMVRDGRASESALAHLQGLNVKTDRRHDRRALSSDEARWLLDTTAIAPERFGMTGQARALLYQLAVETGLRAGELRSLRRGSFHLEGNEPRVAIDAAYAKNRRQDTLPLKLGTAALLSARLKGKMASALAFAVPIRTEVIRMFRADLADAQVAWLRTQTARQGPIEAAEDFLSYRDCAGRVIDFHSLRHTFVSNLVSGGVHPKTAQRLARHSTIGLTMDRYAHIQGAGDMIAALGVLPDLSASVRGAAVETGSDEKTRAIRLSPDLSLNGANRRISVESGGVKTDAVASRELLGKTGQNDGISGHNEASRRSGRVVECAGLENR